MTIAKLKFDKEVFYQQLRQQIQELSQPKLDGRRVIDKLMGGQPSLETEGMPRQPLFKDMGLGLEDYGAVNEEEFKRKSEMEEEDWFQADIEKLLTKEPRWT